LKKTTGLFAWFKETMQKAFSVDLPDTPLAILTALKAPERLLEWVERVEDTEFAVKLVDDEILPDVESRQKKIRRTSGQFYTPQRFARQILDCIKPRLQGQKLDPACGDGSFLLAVAEYEGLTDQKSNNLLNNLYGYDIDSQALLICLGRLVSKFPESGWPVLRNENFLTSRPAEKFSLVIGNPPYRVNLSDELKEFLHKNYQTSEGEKDLYTFFLEHSLEILTEKGRLIMLTSHTYLVNHQCRLIRELVFSKEVNDLFLLPTRFFPGAPGVLPVVLNLKGKTADKDFKVKIHTGYDSEKGWLRHYSADSASLVEGNGLRRAIVPDSLKKVFSDLSNEFPKLGELCRVGVGIQESVKRTDKISKFVSSERKSPNHKPVLKGRELAPFSINWEGKYIDYGPHLAYAGDEKVFSGRKLLYQNIRNEKLKIRLVAAFDDKGFFPKNSLSFILVNHPQLSELYLEAVLNSSLINAWFSGNYHSFHITVSQVRTIPLAVPETSLRRKIEKKVLALKKLAPDSEEFKQSHGDLNKLVCTAYSISEPLDALLDACDIFLEQAAAL
jgi:predicted RNA methylase